MRTSLERLPVRKSAWEERKEALPAGMRGGKVESDVTAGLEEETSDASLISQTARDVLCAKCLRKGDK